MKRLLLLITAIPLFFSSCVREPVADFTASAIEVGVGETIIFTNRSLDAKSFEWDFGDGYTSTNYNVSHYYEKPGSYLVQLKAFGKDGVSVSMMSVRVYNTYLVITVEEYFEPYYLVPDVSVRLYPSVKDWENETNMIAEGFTDNKGEVVFGERELLLPKRYYIDVWGPNHDNYILASEDVGWIETQMLVPGKYNYFTAVVDYYPPEEGHAMKDSQSLKAGKKSAVLSREPRKPGDRIK